MLSCSHVDAAVPCTVCVPVPVQYLVGLSRRCNCALWGEGVPHRCRFMTSKYSTVKGRIRNVSAREILIRIRQNDADPDPFFRLCGNVVNLLFGDQCLNFSLQLSLKFVFGPLSRNMVPIFKFVKS
jgi:hypothetical protein